MAEKTRTQAGARRGPCGAFGSARWGGMATMAVHPRGTTGSHKGQYISLKDKRGKNKTRKLPIWQTPRKEKEKNKELSMYR